MHHLARTTCSRHINCHLRSLLCHQGSTSAAAQPEEHSSPVPARPRSRRSLAIRHFSSSTLVAAQNSQSKSIAQTDHEGPPSEDTTTNVQRRPTAGKRASHKNTSRRFATPPGPPPPGVYKDPLAAIERLSTLRTPLQTPDTTFEEALNSLPILRPDGKDIVAAEGRERQVHNNAVNKTLRGIARKDWKQAFHQGWAVLFARNGSHARLNMETTEKLVELWAQQDEATITRDWDQVVDQLLLPTVLREVELHNDHLSSVATWIWRELAKGTDAGKQRVVHFWESLVKYASTTRLAEKRGDPFYLLQIPTNLFTAAMVAHFRSGFSLRYFIASFHDTIAVPGSMSPKGALRAIERELDASPTSTDRKELAYWLQQMSFIRMWARVGDQSLKKMCHTWRERSHQAAISAAWDGLQEALARSQLEEKEDPWLVIDWSAIEERRARRDKASSREAGADDEEGTDGKEATKPSGRDQWAERPTLPVVFTPEIAADFIRTLLHVELVDKAEAAWMFLQSLGLRPNIIMWTALLHGHIERKDLDAVVAVFREMEKTADAKPDTTARSLLATAYLQAGEMEAGRDMVQQMLQASKTSRSKDTTTRAFNIILDGLFHGDQSPELALQVFQHMQTEGPPPDVYTINMLLNYYSRRKTFSLTGVTTALELLETHNIQPDTYTLSTLLNALLLAGRPDAIGKVQEIMQNLGVQPNRATHGGMINHLVKSALKSGDPQPMDAALEILRRMQSSSNAMTRPSEITYSGIIHGFCRYSALWGSKQHLDTAEAIHDEMIEVGIPPNRVTYNSLMATFLANEDIPKALYYFNKYRAMSDKRAAAENTSESGYDEAGGSQTLRKNVRMRTWQALVTGLVDKKHYQTARAILQEMRELGLVINSPAFQRAAALAFSNGRDESQKDGHP